MGKTFSDHALLSWLFPHSTVLPTISFSSLLISPQPFLKSLSNFPPTKWDWWLPTVNHLIFPHSTKLTLVQHSLLKGPAHFLSLFSHSVLLAWEEPVSLPVNIQLSCPLLCDSLPVSQHVGHSSMTAFTPLHSSYPLNDWREWDYTIAAFSVHSSIWWMEGGVNSIGSCSLTGWPTG